MNDISPIAEGNEKPVVIPVEAYVSEAYARAENEKLWPKVWQIACRVEEIPDIGNYVTYNILDESIIVVRSKPDKISAFYNVCQHRGRRLIEGCGQAVRFRCAFHGWAWNLEGKNTFVLDPGDWGGSLMPDTLRLKEVKLDCWGGWVWINMDPNCEPLMGYLEPAVSMLGPFELDKMRYRWRQWLHFSCNWKVAIEAFIESYHVDATHPQLSRYTSNKWWTKGANNCGWHGLDFARVRGRPGVKAASTSVNQRNDPRVVAAQFHTELKETLDATTTQTWVDAANRLVDELPPGTSSDEVNAYLAQSVQRDDAARGVEWPQVDVAHMMAVGHDWHIFPNSVVLFGSTHALCYRARPNGYDPDSCIFEVYVLERFPKGQEPKTEWLHVPDPADRRWLKILPQDFNNMAAVHKGTKSRGYRGPRPSPVQEHTVTHFHRLLSKYMGTGAPQPL